MAARFRRAAGMIAQNYDVELALSDETGCEAGCDPAARFWTIDVASITPQPRFHTVCKKFAQLCRLRVDMP